MKLERIAGSVFEFVDVAPKHVARLQELRIYVFKDHREPVEVAMVLVSEFGGLIDNAEVNVLEFRSNHSGEIPKAG